MKIRRLQITMEPRCTQEGSRYVAVEVRTDCGRIFSSMQAFDDNHFQDVFSYLMADAEHRIRKLIKEKIAPADNIV